MFTKKNDINDCKKFLKEANLLDSLAHESIIGFKGVCYDPPSIMLEYASFDFDPLGKNMNCSSLDSFLRTEDDFSLTNLESFSRFIVRDVVKGVQFLHLKGIAHRDIKPANVLVCNQHYANISIKKEMYEAMNRIPIKCKLGDFGESRSKHLQTKTLLMSNTVNVHRSTLSKKKKKIKY